MSNQSVGVVMNNRISISLVILGIIISQNGVAGSNQVAEKAISNFKLQSCHKEVVEVIEPDWNRDVRSMRFVYLSVSNCRYSDDDGGWFIVLPKSSDCPALSFRAPMMAKSISAAPWGRGVTAFGLDLGGGKMAQTLYWWSRAKSPQDTCAGYVSYYSR